MGFSFDKLKAGLAKTRQTFFGKVREALGVGQLDTTTLASLEELLVGSDLGIAASERVLQFLKAEAQRTGVAKSQEKVLELLKFELRKSFGSNGSPADFEAAVLGERFVFRQTFRFGAFQGHTLILQYHRRQKTR